MDNLKERQRIGDTIRKARKENKITQKDLSDALKIRQDVISDYENGKIKVIPFEKRVKLADILNVPLSDLLYSDEIESFKEEVEINYLNKEYDLLDALATELEADLKNIDSVEKLEAVKAKFKAFEKKRLELAKGVAMLHELLEEITKKAEELKKAELIQHNN